MTRGEYPRDERDRAPWPVPGAGTPPAGWRQACGLPASGAWHRIIGRGGRSHCLACGERFTRDADAIGHVIRQQFSCHGVRSQDAPAGRPGGDPLRPKQRPSGLSTRQPGTHPDRCFSEASE